MSGTIRCLHDKVMEVVSIDNESVQLKSEDCSLVLPLDIYNNILNGCNFTHVFLNKEELDQYKKEHADTFRNVSVGLAQLYDGRYHLVF